MKKEIDQIVKEFAEKLPKFSDGRIDYSGSDIAPVVTVFVRAGDEFLLLKRSESVYTYKGKWNTTAGYLDEVMPVKEKALMEVNEELGIEKELISDIKIGEYFELEDKEIGKTWIITPVLIELKEKPEIKLDWEHSEYRWIKKEELSQFDVVTDLKNTLERISKL